MLAWHLPGRTRHQHLALGRLRRRPRCLHMRWNTRVSLRQRAGLRRGLSPSLRRANTRTRNVRVGLQRWPIGRWCLVRRTQSAIHDSPHPRLTGPRSDARTLTRAPSRIATPRTLHRLTGTSTLLRHTRRRLAHTPRHHRSRPRTPPSLQAGHRSRRGMRRGQHPRSARIDRTGSLNA